MENGRFPTFLLARIKYPDPGYSVLTITIPRIKYTGDKIYCNCSRIEMGVWLVVGLAPVARPRPGPMLVNKVAQYYYYIPKATELISELVRIQTFPGGKPPDPCPNKSSALCSPYTLYLDHYNLSCSGPVDTFLAQKRSRQQQRKRGSPYADILLELPLAMFLERP